MLGTLISWGSTAARYVKTYASTIKTVAEIGVAVGQIYAGKKAMDYAEDARDAQVAEAKRQKVLLQQQAQRDARISKASILAGQGNSRVFASTAMNNAVGVDTDLAYGLSELGATTDYNIQQFDLQASYAREKGFSDIVTGVFSASVPAAELMGGNS